MIGLFAVGETMYQAWRYGRDEIEAVPLHDFTGMSAEEWRRSWKPWLRGTAIGFPLGVLPCGGTVIPTFLSHLTEKLSDSRSGSGAARLRVWLVPRRPTTPQQQVCWFRS